LDIPTGTLTKSQHSKHSSGIWLTETVRTITTLSTDANQSVLGNTKGSRGNGLKEPTYHFHSCCFYYFNYYEYYCHYDDVQ